MKLTELKPSFVKIDGPQLITSDVPMALASGMLIHCPKCEKGESHGLMIWFDKRGVPSDQAPDTRYAISGTSLDNITLTPDVQSTMCAWKASVKNGEVL